jgi:hypothetical protein
VGSGDTYGIVYRGQPFAPGQPGIYLPLVLNRAR